MIFTSKLFGENTWALHKIVCIGFGITLDSYSKLIPMFLEVNRHWNSISKKKVFVLSALTLCPGTEIGIKLIDIQYNAVRIQHKSRGVKFKGMVR